MTNYDHIGFDAVSKNAADFAKSLMAMADHIDGEIEKVIRKACIDLYRRIVERTPVDTGRAKASWGITTYDAGDAVQDHPDGWSANEIAGFINEQITEFSMDLHNDKVIIYNNLEYIEHLENGTSTQAPYGMVAVSLAEFEAHFNQQLQGLKGLSPA